MELGNEKEKEIIVTTTETVTEQKVEVTERNKRSVLEDLTRNYAFSIGTDIYRQTIFFIYGDYKKGNDIWKETIDNTAPKYKKRMKTLLKSAKEVEPFRGVYLQDSPIRVIWIKPVTGVSEFMGILTHEAMHATADILRYIGMALTPPSEEAYTYLLQHIVENICYNMFEVEPEPEVEVEVGEEKLVDDPDLAKDLGLTKDKEKPEVISLTSDLIQEILNKEIEHEN